MTLRIEDHLIAPHNYTPGRAGTKVNMVVIHIMEGHPAGTESTFNDPRRNASAHYGISYSGDIWRYVKEQDTAWHAGSTFKDNQRSIGIEHEGFVAGEHWTAAQLSASALLTADILTRYGLDTSAIVGHADLHPISGHICPGPNFPMAQYKGLVKNLMTIPTPAAPADPPKPSTINMPLYYDALPMGLIRFTRSTGKAFYLPEHLDEKLTPVTAAEMKAVLKAIGYGSILKPD